MKNKGLVLLAFVVVFGVIAHAATRHVYTVPVNQKNVPDSYALPCTPVYSAAVAASATVPLQALDEAGTVYWISIQAATAGDYVIFRDTDTANASSTAFLNVENASITETRYVQFNPPIAVVNGLSVNISSQTSNFTVCVREADGDL